MNAARGARKAPDLELLDRLIAEIHGALCDSDNRSCVDPERLQAAAEAAYAVIARHQADAARPAGRRLLAGKVDPSELPGFAGYRFPSSEGRHTLDGRPRVLTIAGATYDPATKAATVDIQEYPGHYIVVTTPIEVRAPILHGAS